MVKIPPGVGSRSGSTPAVVRFHSRFPQYLDVNVGCTGKTEVAGWHHLFGVVGPREPFLKNISRGLRKAAGGHLLVLRTLEQPLSSSFKDMVRLPERAVAEGGGWTILGLIYGGESG